MQDISKVTRISQQHNFYRDCSSNVFRAFSSTTEEYREQDQLIGEYFIGFYPVLYI